MVDRAEFTDRGLCDLLSRRGLTMFPSTSARCGDGVKPALETLREVATTL
jgi:hypothetical protein